MRLLASDEAMPPDLRGGVIALGNFDGFHRGHQAVVAAAVAHARAEGRPAIAATFDPHPAAFFHPDAPPFRLTTLDQRARLFAAAGVDATLVLRFDAAMAALDPAAFVGGMLAERFGAHGLVSGSDFTFGRGRAGTPEAMAALGGAHGIPLVVAVPPVRDAGGAISSTRIRAALRAGEMGEAARLLTRAFAIEGRVAPGAALGRTIGFPTANLVLGDYVRPRYGIYAVRVALDDGRVIDGAANIGIRPTFDPPLELVEPHLFDFAEDLYGRTIEVALVAFLRPEERYDTLDALKAQIARDCAAARRELSGPG